MGGHVYPIFEACEAEGMRVIDVRHEESGAHMAEGWALTTGQVAATELAEHGITHIQIVDQARFQAATRLLEDTESRITDIGMELGYADSAHFSRAFKRWAGVTPREYRSHQTMQ